MPSGRPVFTQAPATGSGRRLAALSVVMAAFALVASGCGPVSANNAISDGALLVNAPAVTSIFSNPSGLAVPVATIKVAAVKAATVKAAAASRPEVNAVAKVQARPTRADIRTVKAAGVRQWINCQGSGKLTVVVIAGLTSTASGWSEVSPQLRKITRTCFYDRPGLGRSPSRPDRGQIVDAGLYARELASLLKAAGEPGPYVVVGHSFGGLIARAFAHNNPYTVEGMVLAESVDPGGYTGKYWHEGGHTVDMIRSRKATAGGPTFSTKPLIVLSASRPERDRLDGPAYGQAQWITNQWITQQHADLRLSTNSMQVIARSGHILQLDDPRAVVDAIRLVVTAVDKDQQLTCTPIWAGVSATCRN